MTDEELKKELGIKDKLLDKQAEELKAVRKVLNEDQIHKLKKPKSNKAWSDKTLQKALNLYVKLGTRGYEDMRASMDNAYPCIRTLQKHTSHIQCNPGILHPFVRLLEKKAEKFDSLEKQCSLHIDEINIQAKKEVDLSMGGIQIGEATIGPSINSKKTKTKTSKKPIIVVNPENVDLKSLHPEKMYVKDLKDTLAKLGLTTMGYKKDLKERLKKYIDDQLEANESEEEYSGSVIRICR